MAVIAFWPSTGVESSCAYRRSGVAEAAGLYYRLMTVAFASLRRFNPDLGLVLVTGNQPPPEHRDTFAALGVEIRQAPFRHRPPDGYGPRFPTCFYLLDALECCANEAGVEQLALVDPDVLCVGPLDSAYEAVGQSIGVYAPGYLPDEGVIGLSRRRAGELHGLLGEPADCPELYGGELYMLHTSRVPEVLERAERAWLLGLERHSAGLSRFTTEEHLLSYAVRCGPLVPLHGSIRRMWTSAVYPLIEQPPDPGLVLWHTPAEKEKGFQAIYPAARDLDSWFWTADDAEFRERAGRLLCVTATTPSRLALDGLRQLRGLASRALRPREHRHAAAAERGVLLPPG